MKHFTEQQEHEIIAFYLAPNSAKEVYRTFKISLYTLRLLLKKYKITEHSKDIYTKAGQARAEKTCLKKYGVKSSNQAAPIKKKMCQTKKNRYNNEHYVNHEKAKQTNLERYGVANPMQTIEVKNKVAITNLQKYGVKCVFQTDQIKEKIQNTCINKYGVQYPGQIPVRIQHMKETFNAHTEEQTKLILAKQMATCLQKYGTVNYSQTVIAQKTRRAKYHVAGENFDSFPELCFYLYHIENNINIARCTTSFEYYINNKKHCYVPDFIVNGKYYELNGDHFLTKDNMWCNHFDHTMDDIFEAKHQCAIANSVEILYSKDYKQYLIWFKKQGYKKEDFKLLKNLSK